MSAGADGYVTDVPYVRNFVRELAPAWLDHVAIVQGFAPPMRERGFTWCDLGCGQGITTAILAATHPAGRFFGIDAMPVHIDQASRFMADSAIANATFYAADFAAAAELGLPQFDYIVSHGVYSWVNAGVQATLRRFIDRHLKPGGLVYISYNAMPGWTPDLPFQRLVRALGEALPGDSIARFAGAADMVRTLVAAKAPALASSPMASALAAQLERLPAAYLAHEYMGADWRPLFVTETRAALAEVGLTPVGSATLRENFDNFTLRRAAREALAAIDDPDLRELARDFLIDQRFRRDVFSRGAETLSEDERHGLLLAGTFVLARPAGAVEYAAGTPAGRLSFDNAAARGIVAALAAGPRRLAEIATGPESAQDLLANALALGAAGQIVPVEPGTASVADLNHALRQTLGRPDEIPYLALPCGTALKVDGALARLLGGGREDDAETADWRDFLAAHGLDV